MSLRGLVKHFDTKLAVSQVDRGRWSTLEGSAVVREDPDSVADAEARYAARYRTPKPNPERVVIEIAVTRVPRVAGRPAPRLAMKAP